MRQFAVIAAASLLTGALFALAMPPGDVQILGWVCFVPLFLALRNSRFIAVCLAPIGAMLFGAYLTTIGVFYSWPKGEGEDAWHYAGFLIFGFVLIPGFVAASKQSKASGWKLALVAATFLFGEWLLLAYLPGHIALAQYRSPAMLKVASWGGIWAVSFLVWWAQLSIAYRLPEWFKAPSKRGWAVTFLGIVAAVGMWEHPEPAGPMAPPGVLARGVRVAAIQYLEADFGHLSKWTREASQAGAKLVVWPELSAAGVGAGGRTGPLIELSRAVPASFITTFPDSAEPMPHNAASAFWQGKESKRYFKQKPFGGESGQHQAGSEGLAVETNGLRVGMQVCFDSCYPSVFASSADTDVQLVSLPCMGPESPYGMVQAIHGAFTPFRSAEQGIAVVRAETSAFAMVTDAEGRIIAQAPPGFQGVLYADLELKRLPVPRIVDLSQDVGMLTAPIWAIWSLGAWIRSRRRQPSLETTDPSVPRS